MGAALVAGLAFAIMASGASLPGSTFEIDANANLKVDTAGNLDWANVNETRKMDLASGQNDDSFGNGTKEDTAVPSVVSGQIPNNKSDLLNFGVYLEQTPTGRFLNLFWHRVQEPNGTTNMDFEFNQSGTISANGKTPVRTAGDVLIQYDLSQGGTNPQLFVSRWVTSGATSQCEASNSLPCWSTKQNLSSAGDALGSINTTAIPATESDGLGPISPRTFGEAQIDFDALTGGSGTCTSFGSAYLKSRSSDAFTSALKDFIAPTATNLNNCGKVIIRKQTNPDEDPNATDFGYTKSINTAPATANTFTLKDDGVQTYTNVLQGTGYTVDEDVIPSSWALSSIDCSASSGVTPVTDVNAGTVTFAIDAATDVLDCTYTNTLQRGAIKIEKRSTKTGNPLVSDSGATDAGAVFSYDDGTTSTNVRDNSAADEDSTFGEVCVSGLALGPYTVNEVEPPDGYDPAPASEADQTATAAVGTDCTDNQPTGTGVVSFTNPPLSDIQVNFRDGGSEETSADITCDNTTGTGDDTAATGWDTSRTVTGVHAPTTVTCEIVIDP